VHILKRQISNTWPNAAFQVPRKKKEQAKPKEAEGGK
jgi:hypothetical protein